MRKLFTLLMIGIVSVSLWGQEVQYRKRYISIPDNPSVDDLAEPNRSGTVAYELDGHVSGGSLSSENFQVLDIGVSARRFQIVRNWKFSELYFRSTNTSGVLGDFYRIWHSGNSNKSNKDWQANNFIAYNQSVNTVTPSNTAKYNAYGVLGNRGTLYFTNSGDIRFGIGTQHGSNNIVFLNNTGLSIKTGKIPTEALEVNGKIKCNGIKLGSGVDPDPEYFSDNNYISFRDPMRSEDFIGYKSHTFYFKDSPGGGDTRDPDLWVGGNITSEKRIKAEEIRVEDIAANNLNLAGDLAANNITVKANGNTADFVFEDSYQLKDLSEVESFIKTNKHLPDIPSAVQMEEQGVNLAEMNKLLLQKVEELTLYAIEKDKRVMKLEGEKRKQERKISSMENELQAIKEIIIILNNKTHEKIEH